jgi:hypothetical protein
MHPRHTRNRPLVLLQKPGYRLFTNNIDSPGLLKLSLFDKSKKALWTNAVTCYHIIGHEVAVNGTMFGTFMVEFWDENIKQVGSIISVEVYAPSTWSASYFLDVLVEDLKAHNVISLINTCFIEGCAVPFNTINTIHHKFRA